MKKITTFAAATAIAASLTTAASAAQISDTASYSFPLSPGSQTVQLDQFDSALGTLNWVKIDITGKVQANVTAENDAVIDAPDAALNITANFTANAPSNTSVVVALSDSQSAALSPSDGTEGSGPDYHDFGLIDVSEANSTFLVMNLLPYIGTGTFNVAVDGSAGFVISGTTDSSIKVSNLNGMGDVQVTYDYTPVPEPASLALMGMGGLLMIRRKK